MTEGLNFWYGIMIFCGIVTILGIIGGFLGLAAIRLSVRDDYFEEPDSY
jgi:hypothetical protein